MASSNPHAPRTAKIVVPRPFKWVRTMRRAMANAGLLELGSTIRQNHPFGWVLEVPCPDAMTEAQVRAFARNYLRVAARSQEEEAERVAKRGTHRKQVTSPITRRQYRKMAHR